MSTYESVAVRAGLVAALVGAAFAAGGCSKRSEAAAPPTKAAPASAVVSKIDVGMFPTRLALDPDAHKLYVASMGDTTVIDTATRKKVGEHPVGNDIIDGLAVDPADHKLYAAGSHGNLLVFDTASRQPAGTIPVGNGDLPGELTLGPDGKTLYVQYAGVASLKVVDTASQKVTGAVDLGGESVDGLALNPANHTLYAGGQNSSVLLAIDTVTNKVTDTIKLPDEPMDVAVDSKSGTVTAAGYNGKLMMIDPAARAVVATIPLDPKSSDRSVAIDPGVHAIYVTSKEKDAVSVIDSNTRTVTTTIRVDKEPQDVAVDPTTHAVFVTSKNGGVSVLAAGTGAAPPTSATGASSADASPPIPIEFPFTLKNTVSAVAADDKGIYVADYGTNNSLAQQNPVTGDDGRILLLEAGAKVSRDIAAKVGAPLDVAVGPDHSVYYIDALHSSQVMRIGDGAATPTQLPFDRDSWPSHIAVNAQGDVVLLARDSIQVLPQGAQFSTTIPNLVLSRDLLALGPDGAIYYGAGDDAIAVIDKGATTPRKFMGLPVHVVAIAVDSNNDFYRLDKCSPTYPKDDGSCKDSDYALHKFLPKPGGGWTPTVVPMEKLTAPTRMAINATAIYIADGQRLVKVAKP